MFVNQFNLPVFSFWPVLVSFQNSILTQTVKDLIWCNTHCFPSENVFQAFQNHSENNILSLVDSQNHRQL